MDVRINGLTLILVLTLVLMGYAVGFLTVKTMIPAAVTQIGANQTLVGQVNTAFQNQKTELGTKFTKIETRLDTLEKSK